MPRGMPQRSRPRMLSTGEIAEALSVNPRTIQRLAKQKKIPAIRVGHQLRFDLDEVLRVMGEDVAENLVGQA